jgi:hypothetical protein
MRRPWTSKITLVAASLTLAAPTALLSTGPTTAVAPPAAPIDVEVTDVGWQQVTLKWDHGSSQVPWIYRIDNLTTGDVWAVSGSDTSATVTRLDPEQTYVLALKAADVYASSDVVEVTVTTAAMPHVDPPSDLEVVDVAWNGVDLAWQPSPDDQLVSYEILDLDRDRIAAVVDASRTTTHLKLQPKQTYQFAVRAARAQIDGQQVHSVLTDNVTVTTPEQTIESPKNLRADPAGGGVTLSWERPEHLDFPTAEVEYLLFDGDALETIVIARGQQALQQVIPSITPGDHEYTVRVRYRYGAPPMGSAVSPPSNPVEVTRAASADTVAPEPPDRLRNIVDCTTGSQDYALEGASDDTSPLESLRYQGVRFDSRTNSFYVNPDGFDEPRTGSLTGTPLVGLDHRFRLRAVDEAGNRSEIVELPLGEEEFIGC